ncbi:MAG: phage tail tape measure protein [Rhizobiales bacterium 32-66-8]|nr:MAG: phage tail tape measure protein [Rhizobiales bacterium 32-66-8]
MANLSSTLRISLLDQVSAAARKMVQSLNGVGRAASGVKGGGFGSQITAAANASARSVGMLQAKMLAATAGAYALGRAVQGVVNPAANLETVLLDIAQKADLSDSAMAQLGTRIRGIAKDVGRGAGDMAKGMDVLLGMGMKESDALGVLPTIGKAAVAYGAEIDDLAKAGMSSLDNLKVKVSEFPAALDAMARSGKEGAFELKEMARYLPSLASLGQTLKLKGVEGVSEIAAALQVIRKGSGTSEEAATRLSDVFGKMTSDESVKKFKKLGVDIKKNLGVAQKAAEKAGKPFSAIEFVVDNINKATKGDSGKISEIFADKEARLGAIALVQYYDEFKRIRAASMAAGGEVDKDFARRAKTFAATMTRFKGAAEELGVAIGNRVLPHFTKFFAVISETVNSLDSRVTIFDKLGKAVAGFAYFLGLADGLSFGDMLASLRDTIFGTIAGFEKDADALAVTFAKFQAIGAQIKAFAVAVGEMAQAIATFAGVDLGAMAGTLGTIAAYGATFAVAAGGMALMAKSLMAVGRAVLFLSGIKAAAGVVKMLAGLAGGAATAAVPAAATGAAGAAAGAAATGVAAGGKGVLKRFARSPVGRATGTVGAAIVAKEVIDAIGDKITEGREATTKHGLHSSPQSATEGADKIASYKAEIAEIETRLDGLRAKSKDAGTFDIANQAALARLAELKAALSNLEVDTSGLDAAKTKAGEAADKLSELDRTVTPQVNLSDLERAAALIDRVNAGLSRMNSEGGRAARAAASTGASAPTASRGRSDVAQATANLTRSRQTNMQDREFA